MRLVEGSLEAKSEGFSEKNLKKSKKAIFGGLGQNFHIWEYWPKCQCLFLIWAHIFDIKVYSSFTSEFQGDSNLQ